MELFLMFLHSLLLSGFIGDYFANLAFVDIFNLCVVSFVLIGLITGVVNVFLGSRYKRD